MSHLGGNQKHLGSHRLTLSNARELSNDGTERDDALRGPSEGRFQIVGHGIAAERMKKLWCPSIASAPKQSDPASVAASFGRYLTIQPLGERIYDHVRWREVVEDGVPRTSWIDASGDSSSILVDPNGERDAQRRIVDEEHRRRT
jgi:hypothetical protein